MASVLAALGALCFGLALITGRLGLRHLDARSGALVSIPSAAMLLSMASPFALRTDGFDGRAVWIFMAVGLFFPALVTLLTFRSNELLGPTLTSAVSGTAPLFAIGIAGLVLGERLPPGAALCAVGVVVGIALLCLERGGGSAMRPGWRLLWPLAGALVRGLAQAGAKAGLLVWANPFAAILIGYLVSSATVLGTDRLRSPASRRFTRAGLAWFALTGLINGTAVLSMYMALARAPVWQVAPIVAAYPLVTVVLGALILKDEKPSRFRVAGASIVVASIVYLVGAPPGRL